MLGRPGMDPIQLKSDAELYKSDFDAWLVMQIGAKFGIPQSMLGIQMHSSIGGGAAGKQQSDQNEQFATDAMKNFLIDCINDMARRFLGVGPELSMTATGGGNDEDDLTRAQADASDVNTGIRSRNEIRAERGVPLDPAPEADALGVTTGTGVTFLPGLIEAQQTQQELAAQQKAPPVHVIANADGTTTQVQTPAALAADASSASVSSTSASVAPKADTAPKANTDTKAPANVDAKDDPRQPDTDATKELAAFSKWGENSCWPHVSRLSIPVRQRRPRQATERRCACRRSHRCKVSHF